MIDRLAELEGEIIVALIALFGVFLSVLSGFFVYYLRNRREAKRDARKVLYLLLEVRYSLHFSVFDSQKASADYLDRYIARSNTKKIGLSVEHFQPHLISVMEDFFENISKTAKVDIKDKIIEPLENALSNLSSEAPVLAYRLRGKELLENLSVLVKEHMENVGEIVTKDIQHEGIQEFFMQQSEGIQNKSLDNIKNSLDSDILDVAWYCGIREYLQCKSIMKRPIGSIDESSYQELDKILDKTLIGLISLLQKPNE